MIRTFAPLAAITIAISTPAVSAETASEYLERYAPGIPAGSMGISAQWFEMESLVGWEKVMLVFGYADNKTTCLALARIAKEDSPDRSFRCTDAN
jgi:hypothetical protein